MAATRKLRWSRVAAVLITLGLVLVGIVPLARSPKSVGGRFFSYEKYYCICAHCAQDWTAHRLTVCGRMLINEGSCSTEADRYGYRFLLISAAPIPQVPFLTIDRGPVRQPYQHRVAFGEAFRRIIAENASGGSNALRHFIFLAHKNSLPVDMLRAMEADDPDALVKAVKRESGLR